jgi:2-polyprenyl-3-methyl-5-hydroxy-6-metoxy-1,4-benzoquinol methylase
LADVLNVNVRTPSPEAVLWTRTKLELGDERIELGPYFSFILRHSPRRLLHLLSYYKFAAKMIGPGKRVIDVGCSEGLGTVILAEHAASCLGLDLDEDAIAIANATVATATLRFAIADVLHADIGRHDAAVSLDVIEHVYQESEDAFVGGLGAALEDHGILILGTPNVTSDQYASKYTRAGHVNLFDAERLRALGLRHFHNVFSFSANDELVHTGFSPMAHYLFAMCVAPRRGGTAS